MSMTDEQSSGEICPCFQLILVFSSNSLPYYSYLVLEVVIKSPTYKHILGTRNGEIGSGGKKPGLEPHLLSPVLSRSKTCQGPKWPRNYWSGEIRPYARLDGDIVWVLRSRPGLMGGRPWGVNRWIWCLACLGALEQTQLVNLIILEFSLVTICSEIIAILVLTVSWQNLHPLCSLAEQLKNRCST